MRVISRVSMHAYMDTYIHARARDVSRMAGDLGCKGADLMRSDDLRRQIKLENYTGEEYGLPTLQDILAELAKPGRDPRKQFESVTFSADVRTIDRSLREGI